MAGWRRAEPTLPRPVHRVRCSVYGPRGVDPGPQGVAVHERPIWRLFFERVGVTVAGCGRFPHCYVKGVCLGVFSNLLPACIRAFAPCAFSFRMWADLV